jgi:hypothetical protein
MDFLDSETRVVFVDGLSISIDLTRPQGKIKTNFLHCGGTNKFDAAGKTRMSNCLSIILPSQRAQEQEVAVNPQKIAIYFRPVLTKSSAIEVMIRELRVQESVLQTRMCLQLQLLSKLASAHAAWLAGRSAAFDLRAQA